MSNVYLEQAARGENRWWRYGLTALVLGAAVIGFNIPYSILLLVIAKRSPGSGLKLDPATGAFTGLDAPLFAIGLLAFAVVLGALAFSMRKIHRRPFTSLLGEGSRFDARRFAAAAAVSFALVSAGVGVQALLQPASLEWNFGDGFWLAAALFLILLPIQAATEELLFRGWLSQGVSRLTRRAWVPVAVSSVLFAAPHLLNPEVNAAHPLLAVGYYLLFGIALSVVTLRSGRLELAMGLHTGWNLCAFLVASPKNTHFDPVSLFVTAEQVPVLDLLLVPVVVGLTAWILSRRRAPTPGGQGAVSAQAGLRAFTRM